MGVERIFTKESPLKICVKRLRRITPINRIFPYCFHGITAGCRFLQIDVRRVKALLRCVLRFILVLFFFCGGGVSAGAEEGTGLLDGDTSLIPWRVEADKAEGFRETGKGVLRGNVVIQKGDTRLSADTVNFDTKARVADADGNVGVTSGEDIFSGTHLQYNWGDQTGRFDGGTLFLKKNNFHIRADRIEKTGETTYSAENVHITTCDDETPTWAIDGKKLDITYGGYGFVNHAFFKIKEVPVFYSPILVFPVKLNRQTGLLAPQFGTSERKGFSYSQPFFWAISDNTDATLYADSMSRRGVKLGAEYRYVLSDTNRGVVMFDFLNDRKTDDGSGTSSTDYGYNDDAYLRPNADRYWFRMKHDQSLGDDTEIKLDLDIVSDQDYLYEFKKGYNGYLDSRRDLNDVFGRTLDEYNDPMRKNRLNLNKRWAGYSLNVEALWWDDVIARRQADIDETVQYLPTIYFDRYKQPIFGSLLFAGFESQSAYLYREDGARAFRFDLHPRIYLPLRPGGILSVEPSVGFRQTLWHMDSYDGVDDGADRTRHRELFDVRLDLSSEVYNVFHPDWEGVDALKHAVKLQAVYDYTPSWKQEENPYFDGTDRIEGENLITYSFINTFITRSPAKDGPDYRQAARIELSQSYDINKEKDEDPEPFSPIEGEIQLNLGKWLSLQGDAGWSVYSGDFISRNVAGIFSDSRGDSLYVQHRYGKSLRESIYADVLLNLTQRVWIFSDYERNIKDGLDISSSIGVLYRSQCWSFEVQYEKEDENDSFGFLITLHGLGDVGGSSRARERFPNWAKNTF